MSLSTNKFLTALVLTVAISSVQSVSAQDKPAEPATTATLVPTQEAAKPAASTPAQQRAAARADRLDLDTTVVTGNRELPKVLYIVPWKKAEIGELPAQPFNTLLDEVLQPVDRDVFKREVKYFHAINTPANADPARAGSKGKGDSATAAPSTAPP